MSPENSRHSGGAGLLSKNLSVSSQFLYCLLSSALLSASGSCASLPSGSEAQWIMSIKPLALLPPAALQHERLARILEQHLTVLLDLLDIRQVVDHFLRGLGLDRTRRQSSRGARACLEERPCIPLGSGLPGGAVVMFASRLSTPLGAEVTLRPLPIATITNATIAMRASAAIP